MREGNAAIVLVQVVLGVTPVQVELALAVVLVQNGQVQVAVGVLPSGAAMRHEPSVSPPVDISPG